MKEVNMGTGSTTQWTRGEEKGKEGTKNMEWTSIRRQEFTSVLAKNMQMEVPRK
jgi:hypothetical protein